MKIRKILPLVLLAVGSVFLLSSCDALLDAIFSNDTITVYVSAYIPYYCYYQAPYYILTSGTDTMDVYITGPKSVSTIANYTGHDNSYMYWSIAVPQLADGTYSVQVQYVHPFPGANPGTYSPLPQVVTLPSGSSHSVNLSFGF